jgi:class 3 adenylate cyclase
VGDVPTTKYAKLGGDRIAYQVVGEGPPDLVYISSLGECIDTRWEWPPYATFLERLASFGRLILFDRRGMGASDPVALEDLRWEEWSDDARAVLDTVGSEQAVILASSEAGLTALLFAATQPERTQALILMNATARFIVDADYPWGLAEADADAAMALLEEVWGTDEYSAFAFGDHADPELLRFWAKSARLASSPRTACAYLRAVQRIDVRDVLPSLRVPTLVLHRKDAPWITLDQGRYLAERIPGARFEVVPGADATVFTKPTTPILDHIEEFLTGTAPSATADRALAAVLFTDIVGSTERAAALGDRRWRILLESHDAVARTVIDQHRGRIIKTTGDGVLATFDGPGRAIRCATALRDTLEPLGISIRAGLHTGEIELLGDDIGGIAVHIADRVKSFAAAREVLVSETVPRLVTGSGIEFEERGEHELKGVPGTWHLYSVVA